MFGPGLEGFPMLEMLRDALPADAAAAVENDADLVFDVVLPFLPANVLAHDVGTVA